MRKNGKFVSAALCVAIAPSAVSVFAEKHMEKGASKELALKKIPQIEKQDISDDSSIRKGAINEKDDSKIQEESAGKTNEKIKNIESESFSKNSQGKKKGPSNDGSTEKSTTNEKDNGKTREKNARKNNRRGKNFEKQDSSQLSKILSNKKVQGGIYLGKAAGVYYGSKTAWNSLRRSYKGNGVNKAFIPEDVDDSVKDTLMNRKNDFTFLVVDKNKDKANKDANSKNRIEGLAYALDAIEKSRLDEKKSPSALLNARNIKMDKGELADILGKIPIEYITNNRKLSNEEKTKLYASAQKLTNDLGKEKEKEKDLNINYATHDIYNDVGVAFRENVKTVKNATGDAAAPLATMVGKIGSKLLGENNVLGIVVEGLCTAVGAIIQSLSRSSDNK